MKITTYLLSLFLLFFVLSNKCYAFCQVTLDSTVHLSCSQSNDGEIYITAMGSLPYFYSWTGPNGFSSSSADITGLAAGTYNLVFTDGTLPNCTASLSVTVTEPAPLNVTIITNINAHCVGVCNGEIELDVSGGNSPYSFLWDDDNAQTSNPATNLCTGFYNVLVTDNNGCSFAASDNVGTDVQINVSVSISSQISCFNATDGVLTTTANGGTGSYTFNWEVFGTGGLSIGSTQTINNLGPNTYVGFAIDGDGCIGKAPVNLIEPTEINYQLDTLINESCAGYCDGLIAVAATGGTGSLSYFWSDPNAQTTDTAAGLCAGQYFVTISDGNGCSKTNSNNPYPITSNGAINLNVNKTNVTCPGGNDGDIDITVSITGGPYTYLWNNGATTSDLTNLTAGVYHLTITSGFGCDTTIHVPIHQPQPLQTNVIWQDATCGNQDGSATLTIIPTNPPYTVSWSNLDEGSTADTLWPGVVNVNITDGNGCVFYDAVMIGNSTGPTVTVNNITDVTCPGNNDGEIALNIATSNPPYTVSWMSGQNTEVLTGLSTGTYSYIVEDSSGCVTTGAVDVLSPDSLLLTAINLTSPTCGNTDGSIEVTGQGGTGNITYIWDSNTGSQVGTIATGLSAGNYTVSMIDNNSCVYTENIMLNDVSAPQLSVLNFIQPQCGIALGGINIAVNGGTPPYNYSWTNGSSNQDLFGVPAGNYGVNVTDVNGCSAILFVNLNAVSPQNNGICLVTVDSLTQTNLIVWEKPLVSGVISHYNLYREGNAAGVYDYIESVPYDSLSQYTDTLANPAYRSWSYKISVVDTCGDESPLSAIHKTIHLATSVSPSGNINLSWDHYTGFSYPSYFVNRYHPSTGWALIQTLPSTLSSYTDPNAPNPINDLIYSVEIMPSSTCTSTKAVDHNSSRSNKEGFNEVEEPDAIYELLGNEIKTYPNPTASTLTVELKQIELPCTITLKDIRGRLVYSTIANSQKLELDLSSYEKGIYLIGITNNNLTRELKVICQ